MRGVDHPQDSARHKRLADEEVVSDVGIHLEGRQLESGYELRDL